MLVPYSLRLSAKLPRELRGPLKSPCILTPPPLTPGQYSRLSQAGKHERQALRGSLSLSLNNKLFNLPCAPHTSARQNCSTRLETTFSSFFLRKSIQVALVVLLDTTERRKGRFVCSWLTGLSLRHIFSVTSSSQTWHVELADEQSCAELAASCKERS